MAKDILIDAGYLDALVRSFQANDPTLVVDGTLGLNTLAALQEYIMANKPKTDLLQSAWDYGLKDVGKGGDRGKNNSSQFIKNLRTLCGFPVDLTGAWCAIWVSAKLLMSGIPVKSRGAYTLCEKIANHPNGYEISLEDCEIGKVYVACWKRGRWVTHKEAHVRLIKKISVDGWHQIDHLGGNEAGDKVRHDTSGLASIEKDLIMVVGWKS